MRNIAFEKGCKVNDLEGQGHWKRRHHLLLVVGTLQQQRLYILHRFTF